MQSITDYVGTRKLRSIEEIDNHIIKAEFEDVFRINLDMVPSPLLVSEDEENPTDFEWTAEVEIIFGYLA